jgi:hypothetical protein
VIPTAILAGLLLGMIVRWWAVPAVAVLWSVVVVLSVDANPIAAAGLGAANAAVGCAVAVLSRHALHRTTVTERA